MNVIAVSDAEVASPVYQNALKDVYKSAEGMKAIYEHFNGLLANWPVAVQKGFICNRFGKTFYILCGDTSLPPLVLLHGLAVNSTSFIDSVEALSQHFCVYLVDFPGSAGFSEPATSIMQEQDTIDWLDETIRALETRKVHLLGVSFGAWLAANFCLHHQKKVASLHLVAPPALSGKAKLGVMSLFKMIWIGLTLNETKADALCRMLCAKGSMADRNTVKAIFLGLKWSRAFKDKGHKLDADLCKNLHTPLQIIAGREETLCDIEDLSKYFPAATIHLVDNAGHFVHQEQSEVFAQSVIAFASVYTPKNNLAQAS